MSQIKRTGGGGGGDSFTTIQVPSGTSPVADGSSDTLTLAAGSGISIVGDASTDTVTISSTGTPGGSDTQVQFNDGGSFGGDSNLVWDKSTDSLNVQTTFKQHPVHAAAVTGQQIANVTTASVSLVDETLNTSPTGSITLIAEFPAPASPSLSQNTSGTGFTASGQTIDYEIYPVILGLANTIYYQSANFSTNSFTDSLNDASSFSMDITFPTEAAEQTHWLVRRQVNGAGFNDSALVPVGSPFEDTGFTGTAPTSTWPTQYLLSYTTPTAGSGLSGGQTNVGFGALTADGKTYDIQVRSAANVNGTYFCEQSGTTTTWADPNDSSQFDLDCNWTPGTGDEQVIRISSDGGSTWSYHFVGGMSGNYIFSGQASDSIAETAWSNDIANAEVEYAFKCYAITTSPSNMTVYTPSADTYYGTITTPNVPYIFKHTLSGAPTSYKFIADYNVGVSRGLTATGGAPLIDPGYNTWSTDTTLSPTTYGFTGTNQNREYKLYAYSGSLLIYSPAAFTVSTSASGGNKYVSGSFTYPSGITIVKITRGINGGAHTVSRTLNFPTNTFTDDPTDTTWSGNTTVSPTSAVPSTARYDLDRTTRSQASDNLLVVETSASGDRYPSIAWGVAASRNSAHTVLARIIAQSATGHLEVGSPRMVGYTGLTYGTETWRLGSSYDFNLNKSSSAHFTVWSADPSVPTAYFYAVGDSGRGSVVFGQSAIASTLSSSKVIIAPTAGGTTGLHFRYASGAPATALLVDEAGSFRAGIQADGRAFFGTASALSNVQINMGATSGRAQFRFADVGSGPSSPAAGDFWRNGGQLVFRNASSQTVTLCPVLTATATLDFPSIAHNSYANLTMTVTGAAVGDAVFMGPPSTLEAGLTVTALVSATNTVQVRVHNTSGGAVDPASATFRAVVAKL